MRFPAKGAMLLLLASLMAIPAARAQKQQSGSNGSYRTNREYREPQPTPYAAESLTPDDRLAILSAALDSRRHADRRDCSHFIHAVYERAGLPYEYASSSDLYAGIDEFRRVTIPQAGDLVVWRGHAGIVTNPARHSFFSLLRSGAAVDNYDSPYWKKRGRPRFFRYAKAPFPIRSSSLQTAPY